jgi:hypothetical protein
MVAHFKFLLTVLFCLVLLNSRAQGISESNELRGFSQLPEEPYVAGTRYLYDDFIVGFVYYDDNSKTLQIPLRLNLHNDEFEYMKNDTVFAFSKTDRIDRIVLKNEVFIYLETSIYTNVSGFVKIWNDQFPTLLTKMKIEFYSKSVGKGYSDSQPNRFERVEDRQYIMKSENDFDRIKSVKQLIKILDTHYSELTAYAKKEKISKDDPEELAKLLEYYNELQQPL